MPSVQMRMPISHDFEDVTLYGPDEINEKEWNKQRLPHNEDVPFAPHRDPHYSMASNSSAVSTPTLISDTSSQRSSLSSQSSPTLAQFNPPSSTHELQSSQHSKQASDASSNSNHSNSSNNSRNMNAAFPRRRSVPILGDTTSMASLTIRAQSGTRSRKQREMDFDADQDDDIWPGDSLMFNVPMSPALYAQQKMKHYQMNSFPANHGHANFPIAPQHHLPHSKKLDPHKLRTGMDYTGLPVHVPAHHPRPHSHNNTHPTNNTLKHAPSPLKQQIMSTAPKRSSGLRNSLPLATESDVYEEEDENEGEDEYNYGAGTDDTLFAKQPQYSSPTPAADSSILNSDLPAILARNGSAGMANTSIGGLDPDASDLTLEFFHLEEDKERRQSSSHGVPAPSQNADNSFNSIKSIAMSESVLSPLPSPPMGLSSSESSSAPDSRRSSLTRPENLPQKDPEEEKKHLKEYEKLLRDAAVVEKKKQLKQEEEKKKRAQQAKADLAIWTNWLAKNQKPSLNSDLKWRGLPERLRGKIWNTKLGSKLNELPQFYQRHNYHHIEKEITADSEKIWPDCAIFGPGRPLHKPLIAVVQQFLGRRREINYSFEVTGIAALMLLHLSEDESLRAMLYLLSPGTLVHSVLIGNERIASANYVSFNKIFNSKFPHLSKHFAKVNMSTTELLNPLVGGLFTTVLSSPECASRVMDVFIFEGDSFLLRAALGLLRLNEAFLYECKELILMGMLQPRVHDEHSLMASIRDVTRK